jgi:hypothetical protein
MFVGIAIRFHLESLVARSSKLYLICICFDNLFLKGNSSVVANQLRTKSCLHSVPTYNNQQLYSTKTQLCIFSCQPYFLVESGFGAWYVQNVSTFPNTFAIVSPLICVFWIQLTLTDAVFSRIALVSRFCAEINFQ